MDRESASGLRERKKRATTNSIEQAGVYLALELGHEQVTVDAICQRADISRSTFFNHMPTREAAIFGRPIALANPEQIEALLAASTNVPITTALLRVLFLSVGHTLVNPEVAAARLRLAREQPGAEQLISAPVTGLAHELAKYLTTWLDRHPDRRGLPATTADREAHYLVMLTVAAFRSMIVDAEGDSDIEISEQAFESAIDDIAALAAGRRYRIALRHTRQTKEHTA